MKSPTIAIVRDGKIQLIDSLSIPEGTRVLITPIFLDDEAENIDDWQDFALKNLNECYGKDEPEYPLE